MTVHDLRINLHFVNFVHKNRSDSDQDLAENVNFYFNKNAIWYWRLD